MKIEITQAERDYILKFLDFDIKRWTNLYTGKGVKKRRDRKKILKTIGDMQVLRNRIYKTGAPGKHDSSDIGEATETVKDGAGFGGSRQRIRAFTRSFKAKLRVIARAFRKSG